MAKPFRAISATVLMLLVTFTVLVSFAPLVAAASTTWTSDTDFTASGAGGSVPTFLGTQVVGTGSPAHVDLVKDSFDWANKNPSSSPGARAGPGMAFLSQGNVTLLFGGYNGAYLGDTWTYDFGTNSWTQITTSPSPPGREWPGLSYDPVHRVAVLFGGADTNGFRTDTWEYNVIAQTWSQQSPSPSPPPMADSSLAYYSSASRHILFGQSLTTFQMVTWAYNAATHTWQDRAPSGSPSARSGFATAYSSARDKVVEFGGSQLTTLYSDTYEYDYSGNSWSFVTSGGPSARAGHSMTYRPADSFVYMFGGATSAGLSQETWKYDGSWSSVGTANQPPPRESAAFAQDTFNDVGVLFGGIDSGGSRLGDTHTLGASYRSAGKYESVVFDGGAANADWQYIFWNKTTQPANTFLRFQIATSNAVTGPWTYYGTACTSVTYYTTPGEAIHSCNDNKRYLRFLGDFGSLDTQQTPSMEDVTIVYNIPPSPPYIVSTDPANVEFSVPIGRSITITFSKPMNTASVTVTLTAVNPPGA
ncbi:MAG TPA: kelch repeat-containing protein, partial [Thermoplasmata archaeon]|nr:kelch repeat-containing protein [Thermoplasmata archaeon]